MSPTAWLSATAATAVAEMSGLAASSVTTSVTTAEPAATMSGVNAMTRDEVLAFLLERNSRPVAVSAHAGHQPPPATYPIFHAIGVLMRGEATPDETEYYGGLDDVLRFDLAWGETTGAVFYLPMAAFVRAQRIDLGVVVFLQDPDVPEARSTILICDEAP